MIEVYKLREVLRLLLIPNNLTNTYVGKVSLCPRQTVADIRKRLLASDITLPILSELDDDELRLKIYPKAHTKRRLKVEPNYEEIIKECIKAHKKYRKTIWTKFCEYKQKYADKAYKRSRFYQLVAQYIKKTRLSMLQMHSPGEVMFIDYAGSTVSYEDNGEQKRTSVFVATLGYSKKRFAYATKDMSTQSWIKAIIAAIEFFGGVPEVVHCDNAKAMVKKSGVVANLSQSATELTKHYNVLIDTSQVATPTHNSLAENRVKEITHSILATMNTDLSFFSVEEINQYLKTQVEHRNNNPIRRIGLSANDLFYADESHQLQPLPKYPLEPTTFRSVVKVPENYFIWYKNNRYSVPYEYRNEYIELRVKGEKLLILHKGILRVTHDIVDGKNKVVSIDKHLHPAHYAQKIKTKSHYMAWAKTVSIQVERVVEQFYANCKHSHSRPVGKRCLVLQKLHRKYGDEAFIAACAHAINYHMVSVTEIELILKSKVYEIKVGVEVNQSTHSNLRGQDYYSGGQYD